MSKTHSELLSLIDSYQEALEYWTKCLEPSSKELSQIKAAKVDDPLEELSKLSKLIKAHTTKVGIIFKPETLKNQNDAAFSTLLKLSETIILIVSIIPQLDSKKLSQIYQDELVNVLRLIIHANVNLAKELRNLSSEDSNENESNDRLISVGQIWSSCDELLLLIQKAPLGYLSDKTKQTISLIEDGLEEFEEWAENPEDFDDEDPFGFSDDESDEEEETPTDSKDEEDEPKDKSKLIEYSKKWLSKIKLIKLLLKSLAKSLPSSTPGTQIDNIYQVERQLVKSVDQIIVDLMLDQQVDEETEEYATQIDKACAKIVKIVKQANSNENKIKWCNDWHSKYNEYI